LRRRENGETGRLAVRVPVATAREEDHETDDQDRPQAAALEEG
jgi:hypothetical protein